MQVHADRIFDQLALALLLLVRLLVLRLDPLLDIVFTQHLDAQGLQHVKILVGLDRIDDVGRKNLIELFVGDVTAIRLTAALDVSNDLVEFGLAQNRHALHRRQQRLGIGLGGIGCRGNRGGRQRLDHFLDGSIEIGHLGLGTLDFGRQRIGIDCRRRTNDLLVIAAFIRRQIIIQTQIFLDVALPLPLVGTNARELFSGGETTR